MAISKIILNGTTQIDLTQDTVAASNLIAPNTAHGADGNPVVGTATTGFIITDETNTTGTTAVITGGGGGGTPSATSHEIYFEFSDGTDSTITAYYDSQFISDAITATTPTTYNQKTVTLAELDGVAWYEPTNIPLNTELVDYTAMTAGMVVNEFGAIETSDPWYYVTDYTRIDPNMTFSYLAIRWGYIGVYDENKNVVRVIDMSSDGTVDPNNSNLVTGTLSGNKIAGAAYVVLSAQGNNSGNVSLIRTA